MANSPAKCRAVANGDLRKQDVDTGDPFLRPDGHQAQAQTKLEAELAAARQHLEIRGAANLVISQWRDELRRRVQRLELTAELIGVDADEEAALRADVERYKRACRALRWSPSGRRS